jgi:hypothetical protein
MAKLKHPIVDLKVDRDTPVPQVIIYGRHVVIVLTGSVWVPTPSPSLAALGADIDALEASEATAKAGTKGTAAARNTKLAKVFTDLESIRSQIQGIVDNNIAQSSEIAESTGMSIRTIAKHPKATLAVKMTTTPGMVKLFAKAVSRHASYEWQISTDGGKTWLPAGVTTVASTTVPSLTAGTLYYFRFRSTVGSTTSDWSQDISFLVH